MLDNAYVYSQLTLVCLLAKSYQQMDLKETIAALCHSTITLHSHTELQPGLLRIEPNSLPCSHTDV